MNRKQKKVFAMCVAILALVVIPFIYIHLKQKGDYGHKVVVCIPVYGQSLALGEEAVRLTDFHQLNVDHGGRIVTQDLDYEFGYFDNSLLKQTIKRLVHYDKRSFELSVYGMAESLTDSLGSDTIVCIFPGGQGTTALADMSRGTEPYQRFLSDIELACKNARKRGWEFSVPAICWMQGESDIADYPDTDYRQLITQIKDDLNRDVKAVTGQQADVRIICYQTNAVSRGHRFQANSFECREAKVPQVQMELVRDDSLCWASSPTYLYTFAREAIHIDAVGQKRLGYYAAKAALGIIRGGSRFRGLVPLKAESEGNDLHIVFNVPCPPLVFDTVLVRKAANYGFSVITPQGTDIVEEVLMTGDSTVTIRCSQPPTGSRIRYAINGELTKSGYEHGPRGNLRDSQGEDVTVTIGQKVYPQHNWCYQFDLPCTPNK